MMFALISSTFTNCRYVPCLPKKGIFLVILSRINSKRCSKPQWHKVYLLANTAVAVVIYKFLKAQKKERCLHTL